MSTIELTQAETLIMKCIWDVEKEMQLSEVLEMVNARHQKEWKPQTVSTFLGKLVQKEFLKMKRNGRKVTYEVLIREEDYQAMQAEKFVSFWNQGSVGQFLTAFYREKKVSKEELEELRKAIDELDN